MNLTLGSEAPSQTLNMPLLPKPRETVGLYASTRHPSKDHPSAGSPNNRVQGLGFRV